MNTETRPSSNLDQIRDQQRETWDRFSTGWKKWDAMVLGWLAPYGEAMIRHAKLREDSNVLDVAAGTGEPGLTAAARVPRGRVTVTDLAERMLAVTAENAARLNSVGPLKVRGGVIWRTHRDKDRQQPCRRKSTAGTGAPSC